MIRKCLSFRQFVKRNEAAGFLLQIGVIVPDGGAQAPRHPATATLRRAAVTSDFIATPWWQRVE